MIIINKYVSQSSCKRPPREFGKVVVTRAGRLQEGALVDQGVSTFIKVLTERLLMRS